MNILKIKHIHFVPNKCTNKPLEENNGAIFIFSTKRNGKIYKRKKFELGCIFLHPKVKEWSFCPIDDMCYGSECIRIIAQLLFELNEGLIEYDGEKGEFRNKYAAKQDF